MMKTRPAPCPHCGAALGEAAADREVGLVMSCPDCSQPSFIVDPQARPVGLHHHLASTLTAAELPAPGDDGAIRLEGWRIDDGVELVESVIEHPIHLVGCLIDSSEPTRPAIRMRGSRFRGDLHLEDVVVNGPVDMHHAVFEGDWHERSVHVRGDVDAASVDVAGETSWWQVGCTGDLNLYDATFQLNCQIRSCTFDGEANFNDVKFLGEGNFSYTQFRGEADFGMADFGEGAEFYGARFERRAVFSELSVNRWADFTSSHFVEYVTFDQAIFKDGAEFNGVVFDVGASFVAAKLHSLATFTQLRATGALEFDHVHFTGRVDFRHARVLADADFSRARFGDTAFFQGSRWLGTIRFVEVDCEGDMRFDDCRFQVREAAGGGDVEARFGQAATLTPVDFTGVHVYGTFVLDQAQFNSPLRLDKADIEDNFNAREARFAGEVSLTHAEMSGALRWNRAEFQGPVRLTASRLGSGILLSGVRADDLWDWTETKVLGPSNFREAYFGGRNKFDHTVIKGRFDISEATFTEKLDVTNVFFEANIILDGLRAEHFIISRRQVDGRLHNEKFAVQGEELGEYWDVVAREYSILKRSFAMQTAYTDMDWAHHRYSRARRKFRTFRAFHPQEGTSPESLVRSGWTITANVLEKWIVDWGSGYGTRPVRVLGAIIFVAILFTPVYIGLETQRFVDPDPALGVPATLDVWDAFWTSLGAEFAVGVDSIALTLHGWRRIFGLLEVAIGVGLLTLFISTLSRKMIQ